jgi:hypothetical protein
MIRALCPYCGILGWLAEPTPPVHARIRAEGGHGRIHECSPHAIAGVTVHELGVAIEELVVIGRTLPVGEVMWRD